MSTTMELNDADCALVIEKDLTTKLYLPKMDEETLINRNDNANIFYIVTLLSLINDSEEFQELIETEMTKLMERDHDCSCGGNCGEECECKNG
jgi:hypothetical protein